MIPAEIMEQFKPGLVTSLSPLIRRITAPNASPMTGPGTNTYLVGHKEVAVIDPGMDDPEHIQTIVEACDGNLKWILVTHTHPDHSPGSQSLQALTGAPIYAHRLELQTVRDENFRCDHYLDEGDQIHCDEFTLTCLHTPGHALNHLCYFLEEEKLLLAGDMVMDGATVVIMPPDGGMTDYLTQIKRLKEMNIEALAPAHGRIMRPSKTILQEILDHRQARESMVLDALKQINKPTTIPDIVEIVYQDVPKHLHKMAGNTVYAILLKLKDDNTVSGEEKEGIWTLIHSSERHSDKND